MTNQQYHTISTSTMPVKDYYDDNTSSNPPSIADPEDAHLREHAAGNDYSEKSTEDTKSSEQKEIDKKTKRRNRIRAIARVLTLIIVDLGLPLALFFILNTYSTPVIALICAGIPPLLRIIYTSIRHKRFDFLNGLVIVAFAVSAIVTAISGDIKVILLRDAVTTTLMAIIFISTLIPLKTRWFTFYPLIHLIGREVFEAFPEQKWTDENGVEHEMMYAEWMWQEMRLYRTCCRSLTIAWGVTFLGDASSRVAMVFTGVPPEQIIVIGLIISAATLGVLSIANVIVFVYLRKRCIPFSERWMKTHDYSQSTGRVNYNNDESPLMKNEQTFSSVPIS
ncbi:hypothetical protein BDB00DRAFT_795671 [Zychaea mexicana]|uniref:uncharacterized protein n=1 Tax=Zychaea mexicana TaxID=64656 RepID=UPI0022FE2AC0|nr:uncharacterized protein BDB00DRAFT_795671 [Zychaea mexicana]KAI9499157.1 hypothetical protein BDB00DRAFT_795671 [Zychaea mexicana]